MSDARLKADIWIMAHVRRCSAEGVPATVVQKGDERGGVLLLKLNWLELGCRVLSQTTDMDGNRAWMAAFDGKLVPEKEADDYISRAMGRDPDLWVVEIEHRDGWHPFEGEEI